MTLYLFKIIILIKRIKLHMTREQHLSYCKVCTNRAFDAQLGIICKLTGRHADFQETCPSFNLEASAIAPSDNPYEFQTMQNMDLKKASAGKRFINYLIDSVVYYILVLLSGIIAAIVVGLIAPEELAVLDEESGSFNLISYLFAFMIMIGYYTFMESVFGVTIGKLITGTRVVTKEGKTPGSKTIFLRSLARLIPFEAFTFLGDEARGWHDTLTNTWVVNKKELNQ